MTIAEAIAELRLFQRSLDPELYEKHSILTASLSAVFDERGKLLDVLRTARIALGLCREGMATLVDKGVASQCFNANADQFAAAWRDLRNSVEIAGKE